MSLNDVRADLRQSREERRMLLTGRERIFAWVFAFLPSLLGLVGIVLLIGGAHAIGIALLALALAAMAIPISPLLRARVRRREARAGRRQPTD